MGSSFLSKLTFAAKLSAAFVATAVAICVHSAAAYAAAPPNDNFGVVTLTSTSVTGTTVDATAQTGEPAHAGQGPAHSVWYDWTAPTTGNWEFDTCGSSFDTVLAIYRGTAVDSLTEENSNDDGTCAGGSGLDSSTIIATTAGQRYRIAIDGFSSSSVGNYQLSHREVVPPPPAQTFQSARIRVGLTEYGSLINNDGVGLQYIPSGNDALSPGCYCAGWGAANATSGRGGSASQALGINRLRFISAEYDPATRRYTTTSVVEGARIRVTHAFKLRGNFMMQDAVALRNLNPDPIEMRYRQTMDWDVGPTEFSEHVTIDSGNAANVVRTSDDGFASPNPLDSDNPILFTGNAIDSGPADHGALFDLNFGTVGGGQTVRFRNFYGASGNEAAAQGLLASVGAEAYSLGQASGGTRPTNGHPNTFFFALTGVGGDPLCDKATSTCAPIDTAGSSPGIAGAADPGAGRSAKGGDALTTPNDTAKSEASR